MSLRLSIPWRVALQHCSPPLLSHAHVQSRVRNNTDGRGRGRKFQSGGLGSQLLIANAKEPAEVEHAHYQRGAFELLEGSRKNPKKLLRAADQEFKQSLEINCRNERVCHFH